jgi:hypothetical protein
MSHFPLQLSITESMMVSSSWITKHEVLRVSDKEEEKEARGTRVEAGRREREE